MEAWCREKPHCLADPGRAVCLWLAVLLCHSDLTHIMVQVRQESTDHRVKVMKETAYSLCAKARSNHTDLFSVLYVWVWVVWLDVVKFPRVKIVRYEGINASWTLSCPYIFKLVNHCNLQAWKPLECWCEATVLRRYLTGRQMCIKVI